MGIHDTHGLAENIWKNKPLEIMWPATAPNVRKILNKKHGVDIIKVKYIKPKIDDYQNQRHYGQVGQE